MTIDVVGFPNDCRTINTRNGEYSGNLLLTGETMGQT